MFNPYHPEDQVRSIGTTDTNQPREAMTGADMLAAWLAEDRDHQITGMFWAGDWICDLEDADIVDRHRGKAAIPDTAMRAAVEAARKAGK
jgi:hypothetical protein